MNKSIIKLLGITLIVTSLSLLTTQSQAEENNPQKGRPKASFFEQERKQKFGFSDFVSSALDGSDTFFAADNNVKNLLAISKQNQFYNATMPMIGTLTIQSLDKNDSNFLNTILTGPLPQGGSGTIFTLSHPNLSTDPRIGTINVSGIPGVTTFQYTGSFSIKGNLVSGAIQLIDPKNPQQSYFIQLPVTNIPNVNNNTILTKPVSVIFSTGLPIDR